MDSPSELDLLHLRRAIALAREARARGDRPFGALVADGERVLVAIGSTQTTNPDCTAHAEMNAVRYVSAHHDRGVLAGATLYASSEPCAMCSAAIFYSGIGRIVFGFPEARLTGLRAGNARTAGLAWSSREVLARAATPPVVIGPVLEDEATVPHDGYWTTTAL